MTNKDLAEKYRQEMMNLYSKRNNTANCKQSNGGLIKCHRGLPTTALKSDSRHTEEANQEFPPNPFPNQSS